MLHYKKSRHNLYEQLDYLGLNPYEQRHFCFEGAGSGEGDEGDSFGGFAGMEGAAEGSEAEGGVKGGMIDEDWGGYPTGMPGDVPEAGFSGPDLGIPGIPGYSAPPDTMEGQLDQLYGKLKARNLFEPRTTSYGKFAAKTGDMYDSWFDSFKTMFDLQQKFGYAPLNTVLTDRYKMPVTTRWGYLTTEEPEKEEYENRRSRRELYLLPYKKSSVPGMDMLMDPVIQDVMFSPEPAYDNRTYYTEAVREASQAMTPEERYGVLDPTIPFDDPLYGTRIGGYLPTLEEYNLPTYMGGFRGSRETAAPFALTSPEADRYQEIFMAFDGTKGGAIRAEIDSAKSGKTVEDTLTEAGLSSYGLPREAEASSLANYMDREALKGWFQGLGIVTSMTSPFMPAAAMGLPQEIFEDTIKPALNTLREKLDENVPGFKDLSAKFDIGVDKVKEQYEKEVPETETILDTVFDAIMGEGKSQEAREFGSNYQLPSGVREAIEVGVEDIAPVQTDIGGLPSEAFFETPATDIGGVPASEFLDIEPMMLYDPVVDQMPMSMEVPDTLDDAIAYSQALERTRDFYEAEAARREAAALAGPEAYPFPSRPLELPPISPILSKAMFDQEREANIRNLAEVQNMFKMYPTEPAAPVTPVQVAPLGASAVAVPEADRAVEIQQLAPLPEEVDIEQATFREPSAIEKSTPVEFGREELIPIEPEDFDNLVNAVAMVESNNNQAAIGKDGERGALQVMPGTLEKPGFNIEPARNKSLDEVDRVGRDYLLTMAAKFGNVQDALVAYNAGPTFAESWIARGRKVEDLPETTQNYLVRVAQELN